jgi:hypothetical protein
MVKSYALDIRLEALANMGNTTVPDLTPKAQISATTPLADFDCTTIDTSLIE